MIAQVAQGPPGPASSPILILALNLLTCSMQACSSVSLVTASSEATAFYARLQYRTVRAVHMPSCIVRFMTKGLGVGPS